MTWKRRIAIGLITFAVILSGIVIYEITNVGPISAQASVITPSQGAGFCACPEWYQGCKCLRGGSWASGKWIPVK